MLITAGFTTDFPIQFNEIQYKFSSTYFSYNTNFAWKKKETLRESVQSSYCTRNPLTWCILKNINV